MSILEQTATALLAGLEAKQVSSREVTSAYLDQMDAHDGKVGAFLRYDREKALAAAGEIDDRRARGEDVGPLGGVPVAIKDVLCTKGEITSCASKMLQNFVSPYDATVIRRLKEAGAILIGRTNLDEFAMGGSTENSGLGKTVNPWNLQCVPGGSSGGSAAAVAANMAPLAIGTDTGGSIRQPASFCGIAGLKPTYGRVSRFGLVAFASSLDQIGPMARTTEDNALLLQTIAGGDPRDSTAVNIDVPDYLTEMKEPLQGLKLGIVKEHFGEGVNPETAATCEQAIDVFKKLGAEVKEISLPHNKYGVAVYYIIAPSEASSNLARYDGVHYGHRCNEAEMKAELEAERKRYEEEGNTKAIEEMDTPLVRMYRKSREEAFGPEVKRRIMLGTYTLSAGYKDAYYNKALKVRRLIRQDYDEAFKDVDLVVGPVAPMTAFKLGSKVDDPLSMYLADLFTVGTNLAGLPGMSIPCGFSSDGMPIGLHLQAPAFEESRLLRAGYMFQQETDWHTKRPTLA